MKLNKYKKGFIILKCLLIFGLLFSQYTIIKAEDSIEVPLTEESGILSGRFSQYQVFDCQRVENNSEKTWWVHSFKIPFRDVENSDKDNPMTLEEINGKIFYFTVFDATENLFQLNMADDVEGNNSEIIGIGRIYALGEPGFLFKTAWLEHGGSDKGYFISAKDGYEYGGEVSYEEIKSGPLSVEEAKDVDFIKPTPQYPSHTITYYLDNTYNDKYGESETIVRPTTNVSQLPNVPVKMGYTFNGWYYNNGTSDIEFTKNTEVITDIKVFAKWTANLITLSKMEDVSFGKNSEHDLIIKPPLVNNGTGVHTYELIGTLPNDLTFNSLNGKIEGKTRESGVFGPFYYKISDQNGSVKESNSFYINVLETYTVKFNTDGGTLINELSNIFDGDKINKPLNPQKENYTFDGWFIDETYTREWNFSNDVVNKNTILYAKWSSNLNIGLKTEVENKSDLFNVKVGNLSDMFNDQDYLLSKYAVVKIKLLVEQLDNVDNSELFNSKLENNQKIETYINIKLFKLITGTEDVNIENQEMSLPEDKKLSITIDLPKSLQNQTSYTILGIQDGNICEIDHLYNQQDQTLSFELDSLNTLALVSEDIKTTQTPNTSDESNLSQTITLLGVSTLILLYLNKHKEVK